MPAAAIAIASSLAAPSIAGAVTAWGATTLGVTSLFGSQLLYGASLLAVGGLSMVAGGKFTPKPKKAANVGSELQTGVKEVVRLSDDSYKIVYGKARVGGTLAFAESTNSGNDSNGNPKNGDNLFLHLVIIHAGHEIESFEEIYLNDKLVTLDAGGFANEAPYLYDGGSYVRIKHHLGFDTQTADADLVSEVTNWTTAHRLRGLAYSYMRLQWNPDVFTNGIPTLNVVIKGKKVYDPRTTLTVWSDNAALCIRDYLTSRDSADVPYGFGATADEVDDTFTTAAANICEESITKLDASTIDRYTLNGVVDTSAAPLDNLENMITAIAGAITYPSGKFRIHAGAYDTPEADVIDESWLAGSIKSRNRVPRQELFNAVRGTYIAPDKQWQKDDFPALTSSTYETQDNGERIYTDIELPYTIDPEAAQRIAKIAQRKGREQISVSMTCNYKALKFTVWDVVKLTNANRGWSEKIFRITSLSFDIKGGVNLELREENSLSYDWSASDGQALAAAPDTNLPNGNTVNAPTNVAYSSRAATTLGGDTVYNLVLSWDYHDNAFVTNGGLFEIQFKLSTETDWRPSFYVNGALTTGDIVSSAVNDEYDLRVRAVNMLGAKSGWVTIANAIIGASGGISFTQDWENYTTSATAFNDWGDFISSPTGFEDWGYYV